MIEGIQPIVLVGGRSTRFGRDKLREPVPAKVGGAEPSRSPQFLVDRPITALRTVFGPRVAAVGACHPDVAARADLVIDDRYPGVGPLGGILSALETGIGAVFVLPGDLAGITADSVRLILSAAAQHPAALSVVARAERTEPCVGLYRQGARAILAARLARAERSLHDALPEDQRVLVPLPPGDLVNINRPDDLPPALRCPP